MYRRAVIVFFVLCIAFVLAAAEDFWVKKDYSKWSKAEAEKMLTDSPWAHKVTLSSITMTGVGRATGPVGGTAGVHMPSAGPDAGMDTSRQSTPQISYTTQIRSATPVRRAVVRQLQLQAKYDNMNNDQKAAVDTRTNEYLNAPQDAIIFYVRFESNTPNYLAEIRRYWVQQTVETLKPIVFLSVAGQRMSPVAYIAGDDAFQFTFERPKELPKDGSAVLEFVHPTIGVLATERVVFDFKLSKMQVENAPAM
ncbi:MAG: hypothetical protein ACRD3E_01995 [Terriglobales bacterium]